MFFAEEASGLNSEQVLLVPLLAEELRTLACHSKSKPQLALDCVQGQPVLAKEVLVDGVFRPIELYIRCRAYFHTVAYTSIGKTSFFSLQDAIYASERVLSLLMETYGGVAPHMQFLNSAWASTVHHFSEQVRVNKMTLCDSVRASSGWEPKFTSWKNDTSGGECTGPDLRQDVADHIADLRSQVKAAQGRADSFRQKYENLNNRMGNDTARVDWRGGGKGGKRKNDGGGNNKGGYKGQYGGQQGGKDGNKGYGNDWPQYSPQSSKGDIPCKKRR